MSFNWEDVKMVISNISGYLIMLAVLLVAAVVVIIAAQKLQKPMRGFVRIQAALAWVLIAAVCINVIMFGVYRDTLDTVLVEKMEISEASRADSRDTVMAVAEEGIVLLKNENELLPLSNTKAINVFGWASTNPLYGGTGSGASDASTAVSLLQGLTDAGFSLNTELSDFYTEYRADRPMPGTSAQDYTLPEPTADSYSDTLINGAKDFSDVAVIVISRVGGECFDLPTDMYEVIHNDSFDPSNQSIAENGTYTNNGNYDDFEPGQSYLTLSRTEKDMVELVCSNFDKVVVIYNGSNTLEMGWTEEYDAIKSVIFCPGAGCTGFEALGGILAGRVNPSARTADTWVYDLASTPYINNIGDFTYTNLSDYSAQISAADPGALVPCAFVDYVENIYVGYRFYETAAAEGLIDYASTVQYPFGYGLSYTTFKQEMGDISESNGTISFDVTVTNTGSTAGKDVVEVYFNPPYTNGGIEKASANLVQFEKTQMLEPGKCEVVHISFAVEDMASFDSRGHGCYVLERGDYQISIRANSHDVLDEKAYSVGETVVYDGGNARSSDDAAAVVRFADVEGDESCAITYLSRADGFANYEESVSAPSEQQYSMSDTLRAAYMSNANLDLAKLDDSSDTMPTLGAKNGTMLMDLRGADYDDPKWDDLLDQLTYDEMVNMVEFGGWHTSEIKSIGKIRTDECDGPAGVNNFFTGSMGTSFCIEIMTAQTWSKELAHRLGESIGQEFKDVRNFGWYGPAMNTHRSAFAGRNFEYFSEDGVLAGYIGAAEVNGASTKGVYAFVKHFALNDQEINTRELLCTWSTEQAMREVYLKPFELTVKNFEGASIGVMNSFNFIGTTWTGASHALMTEVLRDEWGFRGAVITDYFGGYGYQNAERGIRAGTDLMLNMTSTFAHVGSTSATAVQALRQSCKNILYMVVNSGMYVDEVYTSVTAPAWRTTAKIIDAVLAAIFVVIEVFVIRNFVKRRKSIVQ